MNSTTQYHGPVTSSVDWCEENYEVTPYIAEFFNSVSSLAMMIISFYGIYKHRNLDILTKRFFFLYLAIVVVGIGSVLFHGTLLREFQALDEVPMIYAALTFDFILLGLFIYAVVTTLAVTILTGNAQFRTFHISYGIAQEINIVLFIRLYWITKNDGVKKMFKVALVTFVSAVAAWLTDLLLCEYVNGSENSILPVNFQLHAVWHCGISSAVYFFSLAALLAASEKIGKPATIRYHFGIIPYVSNDTNLKNNTLKTFKEE
ncbi:Alkaline ceramidase 3 [Clydaea vesicula]|uniref:Alkaline ceramidase 3 n=1 Tax=Clydaea vesicula TaxID=447962 RepID=A0AAD5TXV8_9FUNG|nr:Alkaline ceramidase 3 [Clydaea vesicula]